MLDLDVIADTRSQPLGRCDGFASEITVPGASVLYEFLTRTGMLTRIAGCIATGWSTCAPK